MEEQKKDNNNLLIESQLISEKALAGLKDSLSQDFQSQILINLNIFVNYPQIKETQYLEISQILSQNYSQISSLSFSIGQKQEFSSANADVIFTSFSKLTSLKSLRLEIGYYNNFSFSQSFVDMIGSLTQLEELSLIVKTQNIDIQSAYIGQALCKVVQLTKLEINFYFNNKCISQDDAKYLKQGIEGLVQLVHCNLKFGDFCLIEESGDILMQSFSALFKLQTLIISIYPYNNFKYALKYLGESLSNILLTDIQILIGSQNTVQQESLTTFCQSLSKQKNLKSLTLDFQPQVSLDNSLFNQLGSAFISLSSLTYLVLNIGYKNDLQNTGLIHLGQGLLHLINLQYLDLFIGSDNQITDGDAALFCKNLSQLINLSTLKFEIQGNQLFKSGVEELGNSLVPLKKLNQCELKISYGNKINWSGAQSLGKSISRLENLLNLVLYIEDFNLIGKIGMKKLGQGIGHINSLKKLEFFVGEYNLICEGSFIDFESNLGGLKSLESLKVTILKNNPLSSVSELSFFKGISQLINLRSLEVNLPLMELKSMSNFGEAIRTLVNLQLLSILIENIQKIQPILNFQSFAAQASSCKHITCFKQNFIQNAKQQKLLKNKLVRLVKI